MPRCFLPAPGLGPRSIFARGEDGHLHHIDDVDVGTPGLMCPDCRTELRARKPLRGAAHFFHLRRDECLTAGETALHMLAKEIIAEEMALALPPLRAVHENEHGPLMESIFLKGKWVDAWDQGAEPACVELELARVDLEPWQESFRPDLKVWSRKSGRALHVEILVTHAVEDGKRATIAARGESMIEISLADVRRNASRAEIAEAVLRSAPRHWVHNPAIEARRKELSKEFEGRMQEARREAQERFSSSVVRLVEAFNRPPRRASYHMRPETLIHVQRSIAILGQGDFLHDRWPAGGAFEVPLLAVKAEIAHAAVIAPLQRLAERGLQSAPSAAETVGPSRIVEGIVRNLSKAGLVKTDLSTVPLDMLREAERLNNGRRVVPAWQAVSIILEDLEKRGVFLRARPQRNEGKAGLRYGDVLKIRGWVWNALAPYLLDGELPDHIE